MEITTYARGVGKIMYDVVSSIPDLAYAVNIVSQFMEIKFVGKL